MFAWEKKPFLLPGEQSLFDEISDFTLFGWLTTLPMKEWGYDLNKICFGTPSVYDTIGTWNDFQQTVSVGKISTLAKLCFARKVAYNASSQ